eukprot:495947-Prorocentrum_minimum.AAC.1
MSIVYCYNYGHGGPDTNGRLFVVIVIFYFVAVNTRGSKHDEGRARLSPTTIGNSTVALRAIRLSELQTERAISKSSVQARYQACRLDIKRVGSISSVQAQYQVCGLDIKHAGSISSVQARYQACGLRLIKRVGSISSMRARYQ